ncbi:hypothetical protein BLNAU_9292 [Blattamonas nauphoetae]|uniref:Protein kinase domain-containing protein n=1 Tax=Blattamonas nauphoetae TaxID=2049346 RepID=A0ABQ9XWA8_9EUKA|nr:hypothetical protein BLNAU_9292 [Blattamonas nauphoetae]
MLGCVVSLTSSHLSGSTIRDVNTGGSVLCSNSSFSSLLPSPDTHTEPSISQGETIIEYMDGTEYSFDDYTHAVSVSFSHCPFTGDAYQPNKRPLYFYFYKGAISIVSCSFDQIRSVDWEGGAVTINHYSLSDQPIEVRLCNFTSCTSLQRSGGMYISHYSEASVVDCNFVDCGPDPSSTSSHYTGGLEPGEQLVSNLIFKDCTCGRYGGGLYFTCYKGTSFVDVQFIGCKTTATSSSSQGGGFLALPGGDYLNLIGCEFVNCSSHSSGGALFLPYSSNFSMTDCVVKGCTSATGAIMMTWSSSSATHLFSFTRVQFIENRVGNPRVYYNTPLKENATAFPDFFAYPTSGLDRPLSFDECFTTATSNSAGMYTVVQVEGEGGPVSVYERVENAAFDQIGPLLTATPKVTFDAMTGRLKMEIEGSVPKVSQKYSVRIRDVLDRTEVEGEIEFVDGTGTFVSLSGESLKFVTGYTITSIVGVVPTPSSSSSSSLLSNAVTVHRAEWTFNLDATPSFVSFTTPECPPSLKSATAYLITAEPNYAYVILLFDKEVFGSFDIVVEEEGQDVTITVPIEDTSLTGESPKFIVVGNDRLLTHDTTYTIKSIVQTPDTNTPFVFMNKTVTFNIPKSSYVPPEDPKKTLSPETKALLSWLIPLVACLLLALVVMIVVFVLVYRRKKSEPAQKEMEAQDEVRVEDKMDVVEEEYTNRVIETDGLGHSGAESSDVGSTRLNGSRGGLEGGGKEWVEVMACSGGFEISSAPMTNTLYSVLHKEHREIGKRGVGIQIVNGLKQIVAHRGWSDVLTRLSSHWILIDGSGNVQLKLQMSASEAEQEAAHAQMPNAIRSGNELEQTVNEGSERTEHSKKDKTGMDGMRWRAPEVVAGGLKGGEVDGQKASVFSLGLVLWEIETGQVPFGELDAVNAQRQSGTGIGPKMESFKNEEFIALIHRCVSVDPKQRPTLSEIGEFLSSHPDETIGGSGNEMKE